MAKDMNIPTALELVKASDAEGLREYICDGRNTYEYMFSGGQIREIVVAIALSKRPSAAMLDLAMDVVAPWVSIKDLAELVELTLPASVVSIISSEPTEEHKEFFSAIASGNNHLDLIKEADDDWLIQYLRVLYHDIDVDCLPTYVGENLARRVFELSRRSDLNYFFGSGQTALLAYASLIPDRQCLCRRGLPV